MTHYHIMALLHIVLDPLVVEGGTRMYPCALLEGQAPSDPEVTPTLHTVTGRVYTHQGTPRITLK